MKFLKLTVGNHQIMHGFDQDNKEIIETVSVENPITKLIAIDRIQSISEKFILTTYADRLIYWEYEERFEDVISRLDKLELAILIK
ncbi:hypothetical protein [Glaciimonas soli]|uniref:Uncharacterized protein n=1 Tax=Glaciimonas soli TaxID=2590999 RepID=A0A843YQK1_9BURK|nr:hypothetical protein [Glaciimonas soli]MQQ99561.1 hypothetical protein [Glaciimonas soli]